MERIRVLSRWEAEELDSIFCTCSLRYAVISITDLVADPARIKQRWGLSGILRLQFDDLDPGRLPRHDSPRYADLWMDPAHATAIAGFVKRLDLDVHTLVVHCEAGVSRSPSVAMAIADVLGMDRSVIEWGGRRTDVDPPNAHVYRLTRKAMEESRDNAL